MRAHHRAAGLVAATLLAACGAAAPALVAGSRPSPAPSATPAPPTRAPLPATLWVLEASGGSRQIRVLDAASGSTRVLLPDGVLSFDGTRLYAVDEVRSSLMVLDPRTGTVLRSATIPPGFALPTDGAGRAAWGLSPDGSHLALVGADMGADGLRSVTHLLVLDTASLAVPATLTLQGDFLFGGMDRVGTSLLLLEHRMDTSGSSSYRVCHWDLAARTLAGVAPGDASLAGTPLSSVVTADGERQLTVFAFGTQGAFLQMLDLRTAASVRVDLPRTSDDESLQLLWSLARGGDGAVYVVNAATGDVAAVDARTGGLTRSRHLPAASPTTSARAPLGVLVAEAKRLVDRGAVVAPGGDVLFAIGEHGVDVIDTATLEQRGVLAPSMTFADLAVSAGGDRLYGVTAPDSTAPAAVAELDPRTGAVATVAGSTTPEAVLRAA